MDGESARWRSSRVLVSTFNPVQSLPSSHTSIMNPALKLIHRYHAYHLLPRSLAPGTSIIPFPTLTDRTSDPYRSIDYEDEQVPAVRTRLLLENQVRRRDVSRARQSDDTNSYTASWPVTMISSRS